MREREGGERGNRERRGSMEKDKEGENGKDFIKPIVLQSMGAIMYIP